MPENETILIIDDEEGLREAVRIVLEGAGYVVFESANGEQGLEAAAQQKPDLVLCDIQMPGISGFELLNMFREDPRLAVVPFVFLSGRNTPKDIRHGMSLGADDFLTKPFTSDELLASIRTRLRRRKQEEAQAEKKLDTLRFHISSSVPHELRTPLTGILGFAEIIKDQAGSSSPEDIREIADHIIGSADRLQKTLEKFWAYSEILFLRADGTARKALKREKVEGADSIIKLVAREKGETFQRENDLEFSIPEKICLRISETHLRLLLNEVLENAFRFSAAHSPVSVACSHSNGSDLCEMEIRDKGRGMSEEQVAQLGGFVQFDRSRYQQQGLGLGFSMAFELTKLYGGTLTVTSTPGEGTKVILGIPACRPS